MRALVQDTYGSADVLHLARVPRPEVADNEVLLRVHAAGLDTVYPLDRAPDALRPLEAGRVRGKVAITI